GVVVLFGGLTATEFSHELWEWDGTTWTQRIAPGGPPDGLAAGTAPLMTYDAARQRVVVLTPNGALTKILWEWDGTAWTAVDQRLPRAATSGPRVSDSARHVNVISAFESMLGRRMYLWDGVAL